jgi:hypothetical protein
MNHVPSSETLLAKKLNDSSTRIIHKSNSKGSVNTSSISRGET